MTRLFTRAAMRAVPLLTAVLLVACAQTQAPNVQAQRSSGEAMIDDASSGMPPVATRPAATSNEPNLIAVAPPTEAEEALAHKDLWERVRAGFNMPDLDNDQVRDREQWYANRADYVQRMTTRGGRYLFHIVEEVERRGMPTELALLPFIESAFNPEAVSSAKASGMWQFMSATGKDFDLKQNVFRDDRRDVLASTRAALDYLDRLYRQFGDWHLALAAYNWGQGNVQRAINKNQRLGRPTDYQSLSMPAETRQYVPKLQAVKNIIARPQAFGLVLPELQNHPYFLSVPVDRDIDVALAARLAGLSAAEFKALNPQMNKPVILAAGTPQILLPYDNANTFLRAMALHSGPFASWTAWVAPRTLNAADVARRVGTSEDLLREINRIPPRMLIKAGSTLLVPRAPHLDEDVSSQVADNATMSLAPDAPPLRKLSIKAPRKGISVAALAKQYKVSADQVAQWNKTSASATFKGGQSVVVYVPNRKASAGSGTVRASARAYRNDASKGSTKLTAASSNKVKATTTRAEKSGRAQAASSRKGTAKVAATSEKRKVN